MAKKFKKLKPDAEGFVCTGIYRRRVVSTPFTDEKMKEVEASFKRLASLPSAYQWCEQYLEHLARFIKPYIRETGTCRVALDIGDGWQGYYLTDEFDSSVIERQVSDAIDCMSELRVLQGHIGPDDSLTGDMNWIVRTAYHLGTLSERIKIRPFEPQVIKGNVQTQKGKKLAAVTNKKFKDLHSRYQPAVTSKMNTGLSYTEASEAVGVDFSVSGRTVRNHTNNPDTA